MENNYSYEEMRQLSLKQKEKGKNPRYVPINRKLSNRQIARHSSQESFKSQNFGQLTRQTQYSQFLSKDRINELLGQTSPGNKNELKNVQKSQEEFQVTQQGESSKIVKTEQNGVENQYKNEQYQRMPTLQKSQQFSKNFRVNSQYSFTPRNGLGSNGIPAKTQSSFRNKSQEDIQLRPSQTLATQISQPEVQYEEGEQQQEDKEQVKPIQMKEENLSIPSADIRQCQSLNSRTPSNQRKVFDTLYDRNEEYLKHLKGDCICGKCLCGKCKCPKMIFRYATERHKNSNYQDEFVERYQDQALPQIRMEFHNSYQSTAPMELRTTNQNDFKKHNISVKKEHQKNSILKPDYPFASSSSYALNYINWGTYKAANLAPKIGTTIVPDLHFVGKTIYKDSFNKGDQIQDTQDSEFIKIWSKRANYKNPNFPFQSETTNKKTYKPFKANAFPEKLKKEVYIPNPSYNGQFRSTQQIQFENEKLIDCPSRKVLNEMYKQQIQDASKSGMGFNETLKTLMKPGQQNT